MYMKSILTTQWIYNYEWPYQTPTELA